MPPRTLELPNIREPLPGWRKRRDSGFDEHPDGSRTLRKPEGREARRKQKRQTQATQTSEVT